MITRCLDISKLPEISAYVGDDAWKVPYLYANLQKYGIGNKDIHLYIDNINDSTRAVYLKYYDCLHFFTQKTDYPIKDFLSMVDNLNPKVIMLQDNFGARITPNLTEKYISRSEYIVKLIPQDGGKFADDVTLADENDIKEITDLLMTDPVYKDVYTWDELNNQLMERNNDGYGKCYIIRRDNKIVTAYIINGESDKFYILGGLITHPNYRKKGLGQRILGHVLKLLNETKVCIGFLLTDNVATIELHKKMGIYPDNCIRKFYLK